MIAHRNVNSERECARNPFGIRLYEYYYICLCNTNTLKSTYNEVAFNKKNPAIMKKNLHTKYTPFTYNDITLNEKPVIPKQNLHIFYFHYRQS